MKKISDQAVSILGKAYTEKEVLRHKDEFIRLEAVEQCFALNALAADSSPLVRSAVASKQVGHAVLVGDDNWRVRATVAKHCKYDLLAQLVHDEHDFVRFIVAKRGFGLDKLVDDEDEEIAAIARHQLQLDEMQAA